MKVQYPSILINLYRRNEIPRDVFIATFRAWQRSWGLEDFSTKGHADKRGTHITYRGVEATIRNGTLHFFAGANQYADTEYEFCRKVDFYKNKLGIVAAGGVF